MLLVRLIFCMFADDALIFERRSVERFIRDHSIDIWQLA